eukprot:CAMPEP_0206236188 /NCGR_PEP_ID=MMETSP0047_2-20121206/13571_1 /ASSEMBLY_ACC=CAM_ASM_000192 /TAXON_ID=195065 /ORGANISM="Chroomonas mesostigmatica_cf, Strain CCMP1168" /LENGTH=58 /DNA_ID=CAMNT_0053660485 /DNA_START=14 /DNA_END=187 /DNA_ORIENTATION=-
MCGSQKSHQSLPTPRLATLSSQAPTQPLVDPETVPQQVSRPPGPAAATAVKQVAAASV